MNAGFCAVARAALLAWACALFCLSGVAARAAAEPNLVVSESDDGKTIDAVTCKNVVIKLTGNPTTGYSWVVAEIKGQSLQQTGGVSYQGAGGPGVGAGGTFEANFAVAASGPTTIRLEYRRAWEKDKPPAKVFTITIQAKKADDSPTTAPATQPATAPATQPATAPATQAATEPATRPDH